MGRWMLQKLTTPMVALANADLVAAGRNSLQSLETWNPDKSNDNIHWRETRAVNLRAASSISLPLAGARLQSVISLGFM